MRDLALARLGEMDAVGEAQLDFLAFDVGAERVVGAVLVGERVIDVDEFPARALYALAKDGVELDGERVEFSARIGGRPIQATGICAAMNGARTASTRGA